MVNQMWVIAVSGGPDSMALLHKMIHSEHQCIVAHVNYHMRDESNAEAIMVRDFCASHDIRFYQKDFIDDDSGNFQHRAREFRYDFFKEVVLNTGALGVMVGHHRDDNIETFLIQKERNMLSDTVGLDVDSMVKGVRVHRPLLDLTKKEIMDYCELNAVPYSIDSSNLETNYTRNRIRHSQFDPTSVWHEMLEMKALRENLDAELAKQIDYMAHKMSLDDYGRLDATLRPLILRKWVRHHEGVVHHYRKRFFKELDRQILSGNAYHDFESTQLFCDHGVIVLANPRPFSYTIHALSDDVGGICKFVDEGEIIQGLDLKKEDFPLTLRSPREGDALEMRFGRKRLSRFFVDRKIPRYQRKNWLVIENAMNELIFVVGMGCDVHHYANNPKTFVIE